MPGTFIVMILICSASIGIADCSPDTATDVTYGPEASSVFECGFVGQALIASTALAPGLGKDQYLKIVCEGRDRPLGSDRAPAPAAPFSASKGQP
jgi:hypothetical protein